MNINTSSSVYGNHRTSAWHHQDKQDHTSSSKRDTTTNRHTAPTISAKVSYKHPQALTGNKKLNAQSLRTVQQLSERSHASLKALVRNMLKQQGIRFKEAASLLDESDESAGVVTILPTSRDETEAAEQDYWGVKATAERIINFAKSLAGDDPSKIAELKDAVIQGFAEAERILGGLPQVSQDTFDEVMRLFDEWDAE